MEKQKTYMGHKIKETKGEQKVRVRGMTRTMIWEFKEEDVIGKGELEKYFYEFQKLTDEEKTKMKKRYERKLKKG